MGDKLKGREITFIVVDEFTHYKDERLTEKYFELLKRRNENREATTQKSATGAPAAHALCRYSGNGYHERTHSGHTPQSTEE